MNFPLLYRLALILCLPTFGGFAQNLEPAPGAKAPAKPIDPSLVEVSDVPGLPRVLLIGDSISISATRLVGCRLCTSNE